MDKKFDIKVHKKAVEFRNKKRREYLNGKLSLNEMGFVERWDCEPSDYVKEMAKKFGVKPPTKMFNVLLREEPLSIDIQLKAKEMMRLTNVR